MCPTLGPRRERSFLGESANQLKYVTNSAEHGNTMCPEEGAVPKHFVIL